jgi:hypothetical protein
MTEPNLASYYNVNLSNMLPSVRYAWAVALREKKYEQGTGQLKDGLDRHCCLGVLCDISNVGEWSAWANDGGNYYYIVSNDRAGIEAMARTGDYGDDSYTNAECLPAILRDYWGMNQEAEKRLMKLNDGDPMEEIFALSFSEISDIIIDSLLSDGYDLDQLEAQYEADK